jgi:NADH-quinone oxidoreductase subunit N
MFLSAEQHANLHRIAPEIHLCLFGLIIMIADPFVSAARKRVLGWVGFVGTLFALAAVYEAHLYRGFAYSNLITNDDFSIFLHVIIIVAAALAILGSLDYLEREGLQRGEYYALILFAAAGMGILAGANELVTAFIGLEMSSISTYVLVGFRRRVLISNEASLKYFLLGSFATAFFLYGIAMVYGATGTTIIDKIQPALAGASSGGRLPALAILGLGLIFVGLGFKVVIAPFQVYGPDVYEGAPSPVTALLAAAPKAATFALMVRIFFVSFGSASDLWFLDRPRGLQPGGICGGDHDRRGRRALLSRGVCLDEGGRVPGGYAPRPAWRKAPYASGLCWFGLDATGTSCLLLPVSVFAARSPGHRRISGEILRVPGRPRRL